MTAAQQSLYFFEWGQARKWFLAHGIDPKQADAKRHSLHKKALGVDKSSKDFSNADLDKVLGVFRAVSRPGDFNAQMDIQEQPADRHKELMEQCRRAAWEMYNQGDNRLAKTEMQNRYIAGTARNVIGKEPADCTDAELAKVLGCLRRRVGVMKEKSQAAMVAAKTATAGHDQQNPF